MTFHTFSKAANSARRPTAKIQIQKGAQEYQILSHAIVFHNVSDE